MGLSKANRLKHRHDFALVYARGSRHYSRHLILRALYFKPSLSDLPTRIGIVISKKVSKKAVVRNKLKRRIRAIVRPCLKNLEVNWQIVIIVQPQAIECKYEHFLRELKELFQQVELINGH